MRVVFYLFLAMAGLSGCVTRNSGSRKLFSAYKDSMVYTRLDTSCLHYNRRIQLRGSSRLKEISFSSPDSSGKQYVERVAYTAEEWGVADSAEVLSTSTTVADNQEFHSINSFEKEVIKTKTNSIVWLVLTSLLVSFIYRLWKKN